MARVHAEGGEQERPVRGGAGAVAAPRPPATVLTRASAGSARTGLDAADALALQHSHGNRAVARLAGKKPKPPPSMDTPWGQRVVDIPPGTAIHAAPNRASKVKYVTAFRIPVALIGLVQEVVAQSNPDWGNLYYGFWAVSMGGERLYIRQEALAGSVGAMLDEWRAKDDDESLGNPANGTFRKFLLEELKQFMGGTPEEPEVASVLESDPRFQSLIPKLAATRAINPGYTTCVDFLSKVFANAATRLKVDEGAEVDASVLTTGAKAKASVIGHRIPPKPGETGRFAWRESTPGMKARPKPGDIYVLYMNDNREVFSHMGYILQAPVGKRTKTLVGKKGEEVQAAAGQETWITIDGGQGMKSQKAEAFETRTRWYDPATNEIEGEPNQDTLSIAKDKRRWLLGWVDIDQLAMLPADGASSQTSASGPVIST